MTTFDDRETAFEAKFAHDEDIQFKARMRRNNLLGLWVADKLGKTGDAAQTYATDVVNAGLAQNGDEDVLNKVSGDLNDEVHKDRLRAKMQELMSGM